MSHESFTLQHRAMGRSSAWAVFFLGAAYVVTLVLGVLSLKSHHDPIDDPYFGIMELLIILMAPLMVVSMVSVHAYASPDVKAYSSVALVFMILLAGISSSVHFLLLTVSRQIASAKLMEASWLFAFKWPSAVYALDILAWDWFFALSMLFAAPVFKAGRLEKMVQILMIVSGTLSLTGIIGAPLANMQVRNIGIIGYGVAAPIVFLLLGIVFGRCQPVPDEGAYRSLTH